MEKKLWIIIPILMTIIFVLGVFTYFENTKTSSDAIQFKEEYESLNNTIREKDGQEIRAIEISKDNPFIYKDASQIVTMMDNKETFVVYFGFSDCPWCRSIVPTLIEVAKDLDIDKIYYVDIKTIRDTMVLDDENQPVTEQKGTDAYYELIQRLENVLSDYSLTDQDGNKVLTGEKRISAPNIVSIVKGKAVSMTTGISKQQNNGYMRLTEEMLKESYQKLETVLKENKES